MQRVTPAVDIPFHINCSESCICGNWGCQVSKTGVFCDFFWSSIKNWGGCNFGARICPEIGPDDFLPWLSQQKITQFLVMSEDVSNPPADALMVSAEPYGSSSSGFCGLRQIKKSWIVLISSGNYDVWGWFLWDGKSVQRSISHFFMPTNTEFPATNKQDRKTKIIKQYQKQPKKHHDKPHKKTSILRALLLPGPKTAPGRSAKRCRPSRPCRRPRRRRPWLWWTARSRQKGARLHCSSWNPWTTRHNSVASWRNKAKQYERYETFEGFGS